eukprot:jgi/Ulvmu1/7484/UM037_0028.1
MGSNVPMHVHLPAEDAYADDDSVIFDIASEEFSTDEFRMFDFKVRRCPKQKPHDWTQCPFAHCGERATRRDPRLFSYSGAACAEFRRNGTCSRGDLCPYAHGVFECWLHPSKYKTQMCSDVKSCKRPVCFFAHSPQELRTPAMSSEEPRSCYRTPKNLPHNGGGVKCGHRHDQPPLKQLNSSVNVEAIAAEVEKLLGQKSGMPGGQSPANGCSSAPAPHNPISTFLSSVAQLQQALPGVNMMQLLQAVSGSQPSMMNADVNMGAGGVHGTFMSQQPDINSMISQSQMHLNSQGSMPAPPPQVRACQPNDTLPFLLHLLSNPGMGLEW